MSETQIVTPEQIAIAAKEASEVLPGYTLEHRIGSGGFGEVWKAAAPGGLEKAVKILYGHFDEEQAETELKSLERVRQLHHPFLLNIERIEVASGRLIIVTELAEESLEDRFRACRKLDFPGIPYEELLGYLRDAADALDFMATKHGLQHLDVKPDNLLLQSGHVKVADFGLTKDLSQTQISLVGAFTPLYAPPELYEGQPSPSSDQYSLAIVYQVMLTGIPPFLGRTAAQLASQHLSSQPNLQPLPMMDRPAVARALSKNPDARFSSCREFLDELDRRRTGETERKPRAVAVPIEKKQPADADVLVGSTEFVNTYVESRPFHVGSVDAAQVRHRPTLVIGLGGIAGRVLGRLKERIQGRFGEEAELPGLGLLYLDSDSHAISRAARGPLSYQETLTIPLRSPQDYKNHEVDFSDWLSRRWFYNIPRSRQVQGMRALGRLAFADHQRAIRERVREHLTRMISEDTLALMQEQTGLAFESGPPNVIVLSSITGGTGGGAVLDLGYLLRDELSGMALDGGDIQGVLLFGTDFRDSDRDVAIANALCLLRELNHFHRSTFPGDATCDLPEIPEPPFRNTYLVHLGEELNDRTMGEGVGLVAEYLYRETFTPARAFFQQLRATAEKEAEPFEEFHTFGVRLVSPAPSEEQKHQSRDLIDGVLANWTRPLSEAEQQSAKNLTSPWCEAKFDALGWKLNQLQERGIETMRGGEGPRFEAWIAEWLAPFPTLPNSPKKAEKMFDGLVRRVDEAFESDEDSPPRQRLRQFQDQLHQQAEESANLFQDAIWSAMDSWPHPFDAGQAAIEHALAHLENCRSQLSLVVQQLTAELVSVSGKGQSPRPCPRTREELEEFLCRYADLRFCYEVHRALSGFVGSIRASLGSLPGEIHQLRQAIEHTLPADPEPEQEHCTGQPTDWVEPFDQDLRRKGQRKLKTLRQSPDSFEDWHHQLKEEAGRFLLFSVATPPRSEGVSANPWNAFCSGAKPQLDGLGGLRSLVLVAPDNETPELEASARELFGDCVTVLPDPAEPLFLCCETRNLTLIDVQKAISDVREDLKEVASRLHTRIDVEWRD